MSQKKSINRRFCVAPMLDCTDRHERFLLRLISSQVLLYPVMVTTGALLYGDTSRFLQFDAIEHPVALQLGGSDSDAMTRCAELAQEWGYDEVNINVGCPSDRVQSGHFGACLMHKPELVADSVREMVKAVDIPVSVKCRIGVDEQDPNMAFWQLVEQSASAGCSVFIVHARKAWLQGLSPKQNRDVPPLDYDLVYKLKQDFPELDIIINGGIDSLPACHEHLKHVDGVMVGREAYSNPYLLSGVDQQFYGSHEQPKSRHDVYVEYQHYAENQMRLGCRLNHLTKHVVGLYHGEPRSRLWRRYISENAHKPDANSDVLQQAYLCMTEG
jgi:tRNA-dihydrouridine synthase A